MKNFGGGKFCSRPCYNEWQRIDYGKVAKWIRESKEYKEWRTSVFERDKYTCSICGILGCTLNAHHVKGFTMYPEYIFDIDNGITLCVDCHYKTNNYGRKGMICDTEGARI